MTLEDFEKSLEEDRERRHKKSETERHHRERSRHHHHHREPRHRDDNGRHKQSRHSTDQGDENGHARKRRHRDANDENDSPAPKVVVQEEPTTRLKRDAWMEAPSSLEVDYVHRPDTTRLEEQPRPKMLQADFELKIHDRELNDHLRDLKEGKAMEDVEEEPVQHVVDYTFGDAGSMWRMTKLKGVYREAETSGRPVDEVAAERFGDLRSFDDAREEETELDRRRMYGQSYVGKEKPSGELFQERKLNNDVRRAPFEHTRDPEEELRTEGQGKRMDVEPPARTSQHLDLTALNRLKAQMMKAKLKGASDAAELEERYNAAAAAAAMSNRKESDVVVLGVKENRMLAGTRNEVKPVETRRGREKGRVQENEDMSIEDMVREERKTRGQAGGEGQRLAERISRDAKFEVNLRNCFALYVANTDLE